MINRQVLALSMSIGAAVALMITYALGGNPRWEGALLGAALGGIGWALVVAAHHQLDEVASEERSPLRSSETDRQAVVADIARAFTRRHFVGAMFVGAIGTLALAVGFPLRSLGVRPGAALFETAWAKGRRLVDSHGQPVRSDAMEPGAAITVFPEGSNEAADSVAMLLRVDPARVSLPAGRTGWAPDGYLAYSKICTHAGCPVGLFDTETGYLVCPCHQSSFDALHGAQPVFGPAARALPQLPLEIDDGGFIVAAGEMSHPVGPGFFDLPRGDG